MHKTLKTCSRCQGTGNEPMPGKGKGKFRKLPKLDEVAPEDMSLEEQTRAFLRSHGY